MDRTNQVWERAIPVSEEEIIEGLAWAHQNIQPAIDLQNELREKYQAAGYINEREIKLILPDEAIQTEVENK